ncbi:septation protein SepH [Nocardioides salsibiostraticola]
MSPLTYRSVSDDGARVVLVDEDGIEFSLEITPALRTALGTGNPPAPGPSRTGQLEKKMDNTLRPRDIQARIRAGESPEALASAAGMTIEKVMIFAGPVLAEREHVAQRAQKATVRRATGDGSHARTLGEAVETQLQADNVDPDSVEWDAWRREDGRWSLIAAYDAGHRDGTGTFTFDAPGNYVVLEDDDARWLVGEIPVVPASSAQPDDLQQVRSRRLAAVSPDQLPLGDDAIEMVGEPLDDAESESEQEMASAPTLVAPAARQEPPSIDDFFNDADDAADLEKTEEISADGTDEASDAPATEEPAAPAHPTEPAEPAEPAAEEETQTRRPVTKKKGRASVPSWDEIMFGGGDQ